MATFSVEIADKDVERVIEAICVNYNRPDTVDGLDNPESKSVFANRIVREYLSEHVRKYELDRLKETLKDSISNPTITDPQV
tara:strand:- start:743 stop:988 length:246 start_codon:yes stop_codon:yes gene_type:complete